jgi:hypothetical protein
VFSRGVASRGGCAGVSEIVGTPEATAARNSALAKPESAGNEVVLSFTTHGSCIMSDVSYANLNKVWAPFLSELTASMDQVIKKIDLYSKSASAQAKKSGGIAENARKEIELLRKLVDKLDDSAKADKMIAADRTGYLESMADKWKGKKPEQQAKIAKEALASEERRLEILEERESDSDGWKKGLKDSPSAIKVILKSAAGLAAADSAAGKLMEVLSKSETLFRGASKMPDLTEEKFIVIKEKVLKAADDQAKKMVVFKDVAKSVKQGEDILVPVMEGLAPTGLKVPKPLWSEAIDSRGMEAMKELKMELDRIGRVFNDQLTLLRERWQAASVSESTPGPTKDGPKIGKRGAA